jgi:hypothetical protein
MDNDDETKARSCNRCNARIESRGKRDAHIDLIYKESKTLKYSDGTLRTIIKNENGHLICVCGRSYDYFKSLTRHVKSGCQGQAKEDGSQSNKENEVMSSGKSKPGFWLPIILTDVTMSLLEQSRRESDIVCYLFKFQVAVTKLGTISHYGNQFFSLHHQ